MLLFFILVECLLLTNPNNGMLSCSLGGDGLTNPGDTCVFTCNNGYELIGNDMRICLPNGTWSGSDPVCEISE